MQTASPARPPSLRDAQRMLTRTRIRDAGREAFFARGYDRTTIDEIAQAAGASRSTLYVHFRDKDEILAAIVADYVPGLLDVVARLHGPLPARAEIDAWLRDLAAFIARERTPTVLIAGMASAEDAPPAIHALGDRLVAALAARLPAFARALADGPDRPLVRAWASVVIREVGWACQHAARHPGGGGDGGAGGGGEALLTVAGDLFERFLRDHTDGAHA